jgi:hypothetical protein
MQAGELLLTYCFDFFCGWLQSVWYGSELAVPHVGLQRASSTADHAYVQLMCLLLLPSRNNEIAAAAGAAVSCLHVYAGPPRPMLVGGGQWMHAPPNWPQHGDPAAMGRHAGGAGMMQ